MSKKKIILIIIVAIVVIFGIFTIFGGGSGQSEYCVYDESYFTGCDFGHFVMNVPTVAQVNNVTGYDSMPEANMGNFYNHYGEDEIYEFKGLDQMANTFNGTMNRLYYYGPSYSSLDEVLANFGVGGNSDQSMDMGSDSSAASSSIGSMSQNAPSVTTEGNMTIITATANDFWNQGKISYFVAVAAPDNSQFVVIEGTDLDLLKQCAVSIAFK